MSRMGEVLERCMAISITVVGTSPPPELLQNMSEVQATWDRWVAADQPSEDAIAQSLRDTEAMLLGSITLWVAGGQA